MTEFKHPFRLRYLLSFSYLAVKLAEIRSPSDALSRAANVPVYIFFLMLNTCYSARGRVARARKALSDAAFSDGWLKHPQRAGDRLINFSRRVCRLASNTFLESLKKLGFTLGDRRRDAALRTGLAGIRPVPPSAAPQPEHTRPPNPFKVLWLINPACNYRCHYCWLWSKHQQAINKSYIKRSLEEYTRSWERFNRLYGQADIDILGGEPFVSPDFPEVLSVISKSNRVCVTTNLSWDPETIIGRLDPAHLSFSASYHPEYEPSLEHFIAKIAALRKAGFSVIASIVAFPNYFPKLPLWLDAFYQSGIYVHVQPFIGWWRGRGYPRNHTELQREVMRDVNSCRYMFPRLRSSDTTGEGKDTGHEKRIGISEFALNFQLADISPKGKSCNAGVSYFRIFFSGNVARCGQGGETSGLLGNFFSTDFHPLNTPLPCPFDKCECLGENCYMEGGPLGPVAGV